MRIFWRKLSNAPLCGTIFFVFYLVSVPSTARSEDPNYAIWRTHPFYMGATIGYGSTDWSQLVANWNNNQLEYDLLSVAAPIAAGDRGAIWGLFMGYELQPHFAMEINYRHFPDTTVYFDQFSVYTTSYGTGTAMRSYTYAYDAVGKFMVEIAHTGIRGFANAGGAYIHRHDVLTDTGHICPTFGVGVNYVFLNRILFEVGFQYYAGYGKAVLTPAINYIPFLYAITGKIGYRF